MPVIVSPLPQFDATGGEVIVTSGFGGRWINGVYGGHMAVDLGSTDGIDWGTPEHAVEGGVILRVGNDGGPPSAGINIWLLGDSGVGWKYFHMADYVVEPGQRVEAGQLVGHAGNTGTGAVHLHLQKHLVQGSTNWSMWTDATAVDPEPDVRAAWAAGRFPERGAVLPPPTPDTPTPEDWFEMATKDDLKAAVREVLGEDEIRWEIAKDVAGVVGSGDGMPGGYPSLASIQLGALGTFIRTNETVAAAAGKRLEWDQGVPKILAP